jgi:hypothetical protein
VSESTLIRENKMGGSSSKGVTPPLFVAIYDFRGGSKNELTIRNMDQLTILNDNDKTNVREPSKEILFKN